MRAQVMSAISPIDRSGSPVSLAPSDTTYHSFQDMELQEPDHTSRPNSERQTTGDSALSRAPKWDHHSPIVQEIRRQDSGYESMVRRDSRSSRRRTSSASVTSSARRQPRPRSSKQRSSKSSPVSQAPRKAHQPVSSRPGSSCPSRQQQQQQQSVAFFQFPRFITAEPQAEETEMGTYPSGTCSPPSSETAVHPLPPQTTHYWTSDRTRRLEYAAIDAASRGVRGWIRRHVVPECFVPKEKRHIGFEDDRGSVVRYRLDLEEEDKTEKSNRAGPQKRRRGWWFTIHH